MKSTFSGATQCSSSSSTYYRHGVTVVGATYELRLAGWAHEKKTLVHTHRPSQGDVLPIVSLAAAVCLSFNDNLLSQLINYAPNNFQAIYCHTTYYERNTPGVNLKVNPASRYCFWKWTIIRSMAARKYLLHSSESLIRMQISHVHWGNIDTDPVVSALYGD